MLPLSSQVAMTSAASWGMRGQTCCCLAFRRSSHSLRTWPPTSGQARISGPPASGPASPPGATSRLGPSACWGSCSASSASPSMWRTSEVRMSQSELSSIISDLGLETQFTRLGMGGYWGNKGCVSVRWSVYGVSVCVINCHLAAHVHMNKVRGTNPGFYCVDVQQDALGQN